MNKVKLYIAAVIFCLSVNIFSQEDTSHTALVYGNDNSFTVKAPKGWVLDNKSGVSVGLFAVFYPLGSSWEKAISVMYCNTASKKAKGNETLQEVIDFDVNRFKNEYKAEVKDGDNLMTSDGKTAILKLFYDTKKDNYETVAYIDEKNVVVFLVLSSRNKSDFEDSMDSFKDFVTSYSFLTENVKINDK